MCQTTAHCAGNAHKRANSKRTALETRQLKAHCAENANYSVQAQSALREKCRHCVFTAEAHGAVNMALRVCSKRTKKQKTKGAICLVLCMRKQQTKFACRQTMQPFSSQRRCLRPVANHLYSTFRTHPAVIASLYPPVLAERDLLIQ